MIFCWEQKFKIVVRLALLFIALDFVEFGWKIGKVKRTEGDFEDLREHLE